MQLKIAGQQNTNKGHRTTPRLNSFYFGQHTFKSQISKKQNPVLRIQFHFGKYLAGAVEPFWYNRQVASPGGTCMTDNVAKLNSQTFADHLHSKFKVHLHEAPPLEVELIEVNDRPTVPDGELFSLTFLGPASPLLVQRIHRLEHEKLGQLEIFLTPIGADQRGTSYEAVFHRLRKAAP